MNGNGRGSYVTWTAFIGIGTAIVSSLLFLSGWVFAYGRTGATRAELQLLDAKTHQENQELEGRVNRTIDQSLKAIHVDLTEIRARLDRMEP